MTEAGVSLSNVANGASPERSWYMVEASPYTSVAGDSGLPSRISGAT